MRNALISFALVVAGTVVALIFFEIAYRITENFSVRSSWSDRPKYYYKPAMASLCRDYRYTEEKQAGVFRIAVLGDSFTYATSMQFDDSFAKKLERMLNLNSDGRAEVLNFGVPGYSTYHEAEELQRVSRFKPDLILLQVTLNDTQTRPYRPTGMTGHNQFGPYQPSASWARVFRHWRSLGFVVARIHNTQTHKRYVQYYFSLFEPGQGLNKFQAAVRDFAQYRQETGTPVAAVLFPLFGMELDDRYPFHPLHAKVRGEFQKHDIPLLDLFSVFEGIPLGRLQVVPAEDFHPNEIGHRLAAEAIYHFLEIQKLLPQQVLIRDRFRRRLDTDCKKNQRLTDADKGLPRL